ncbi:MAG: hypothetical protein J6L67_06470, partial [Alphaproteobacteria bacterium]|nr:hypothetical protein [Alphaproteobacteria bacterium]
ITETKACKRQVHQKQRIDIPKRDRITFYAPQLQYNAARGKSQLLLNLPLFLAKKMPSLLRGPDQIILGLSGIFFR